MVILSQSSISYGTPLATSDPASKKKLLQCLNDMGAPVLLRLEADVKTIAKTVKSCVIGVGDIRASLQSAASTVLEMDHSFTSGAAPKNKNKSQKQV